jgi:agmatine deiminase
LEGKILITDGSTNFLYLADTLPIKYPTFYHEFEKILNECKIDFGLLPNTKDIWAVDYMPVQVRENHFVQFAYKPDYLKPKKYAKTISDVDSICKSIGIPTEHSSIVLDGGNVSRSANKVIMTSKVFRENPLIEEKQLIRKLQHSFKAEQLIIVPEDSSDFTGHADGMVRFLDENTVLINDYRLTNGPAFQLSFRMALHNAGLEYIEILYCPDFSARDSAQGLYLNYLQMENVIIIPTFGINQDDVAMKQLEAIFGGQTIKKINGNDLAGK